MAAPSAQVTIGANLARTPNAAFGAPGNVTLPGALAFFPAFSQQQATRADGAGVAAVVPLLAATFVGCPGARAVARAAQAGCPGRAAPVVSAVRLSGRRLSLRVSEPAQLTVTLQRCARRCRTVRRLTASAPSAGAVRLRVPRAMRKARYRVSFEAADAAGNRSTRTFRLRS